MADVVPEPVEEERAHEAAQARGMAVAKWHELIADTISLMSNHVDPADPRAADIAQRFSKLEAAQPGSLDQMFILAENVTPHHGAAGSFDVLRDSVVKYLEDVRAAQDAGVHDAGDDKQ